MQVCYDHQGSIYNVVVERRDDKFYVLYNNNEYVVQAEEQKPGELRMMMGDRLLKCIVGAREQQRYVFLNGEVFELKRCQQQEGGRKSVEANAEDELKSPISGTVVAVKTKSGDQVKKGDVVMVIEAMKMEYLIRAPFDGTIEKIHFQEGNQIEIGNVTVDLKPLKEE